MLQYDLTQSYQAMGLGTFNTLRDVLSTHGVIDNDHTITNNLMMDREQRKKEAGHRLRMAWERAGFDSRTSAVDELARLYGETYTYSAIGNYVSGIRPFGPDEAYDFGRAFNCSPSWLLCLDDNSPMSPEEKALLDNYRATDERGRRVITRIAEQESPEYLGENRNTA